MSEFKDVKDYHNVQESDLRTLPQGLNVLTILTYIGSAMQLLGAFYNYFTIGKSYQMIRTANEGMGGGNNEFVEKIMSGASEMIKKQYKNRTLLLISAVVFAIVCFLGAMLMRNKKMIGYYVYLAGELIYPAIYTVLIGFSGFGVLGILGFIFPIVFVILYTLQRKYLTN